MKIFAITGLNSVLGRVWAKTETPINFMHIMTYWVEIKKFKASLLQCMMWPECIRGLSYKVVVRGKFKVHVIISSLNIIHHIFLFKTTFRRMESVSGNLNLYYYAQTLGKKNLTYRLLLPTSQNTLRHCHVIQGRAKWWRLNQSENLLHHLGLPRITQTS